MFSRSDYSSTCGSCVSAVDVVTAPVFSFEFDVEETTDLAGEIAELFSNKAIKTVKHNDATLALKARMVAALSIESVVDDQVWSLSF